jgi:alcohol dehydrogenase
MAYTRELSFIYRNPTKIIFGENAVDEVGAEVDELGGTKTLIVTDEGIVKTGLVERLEKALGDKCGGVFDQCTQDSGVHIVENGYEFAKGKSVDILVSIGGGSVIDTAKGMAILLKEGGKMSDYVGFQMLEGPVTPHIVIPTTTGTGSEVTYAAVIKDHTAKVKQLFCDNHLIPNVAILDPTVVAGLPPQLTASTGMDALCHCVEAIHSLQREPIADALALHAIRLIMVNLPRCVEKGDDLVARGQQQIAATLAGIAFGNSQVGMVHAMAHTIGGKYGVPHGIANGILLPYCIMYNLDECPDRYAMVAEAMGVKKEGMSDTEAGEAAANAIWELTKKMGLPQKLREVGVPKDGLEECAEASLYDGSIVYNPKTITEAQEVLGVFEKAW